MNQQEEEFVERLLVDNTNLRNQTYRLMVFVKALTDPEMYGHAVSAEVRNAASLFVRQMERR